MTHRPDSVFPPAPPGENPRTAADLFVDCLESEGVEFVFGIPGEETLDLSEALDRSQLITFVPTRHEQGAAFMADAYGRLTGRPGVCLATLGPGRQQPRHGHRRRDARPRAAGRAHRPDRPRRHAQGDHPPVHRHRGHAGADDQVEHAHPPPAHGAGGGAQGVQHRRRREAGSHAPGAARGHHGRTRRRARRCPTGPEADDRGRPREPAARRRDHPGRPAAGHPRRQRRRAPGGGACAARLLRGRPDCTSSRPSWARACSTPPTRTSCSPPVCAGRTTRRACSAAPTSSSPSATT